METLVSSTMSPVAVYEYLLVAHPASEINQLIVAEKQFFYDKYKEKSAIKTQPHITVAGFLAKERMEETIARYVQRVCSQFYCFDVELNNFSGFPEHTIYLRVQNPQPFKSLARELKVVSPYITSCSCPAPKLVSNPHLTIARGLPEAVYSKAIIDYSQRSFYGRFEVNELVLLRRSSEFESCKVVYIFPLQPQPKQGDLFD